VGANAGGGAVVAVAPATLDLSILQGAFTAFAGARFKEAAGLGGGARCDALAHLVFCGVTAVSTSEGRGRMAAGVGGGAGAGVGGGGPADAMIWARWTSKDGIPPIPWNSKSLRAGVLRT
jgi:hypothetical protein